MAKRAKKGRKRKRTPKKIGEKDMRKEGCIPNTSEKKRKKKNQVAPKERVSIHINDCKRR